MKHWKLLLESITELGCYFFFPSYLSFHTYRKKKKNKLCIYFLQYSILTLQHKSCVCFLSFDSNSQIGRQLKRKPLLKPPTRNTIATSMYQHLPITSFSSAYSCLFFRRLESKHEIDQKAGQVKIVTAFSRRMSVIAKSRILFFLRR